MNSTTSRYGNSLKPFKVRFFIAAALFLAVAVICVSQRRSHAMLEKTFNSLVLAQSGRAQVKEADANRRQVLKALQSQVGQDAKNDSPEIILYGKTDEIKARLNPDEMTITAMEQKGEESALQYTLTFNDPDFNDLLNAVNYLHESVFPMAPVSAITITRTGTSEAPGVSFNISGKIILVRR